MRGAPRVIKNRTAWDQKHNSHTMTKKTKRSDDASADSTDDADFFSSAVRHSGWQSCS